ncbi:Activating signal cointegrator 1 complex subunit 1-like protein [Drosera capensis]
MSRRNLSHLNSPNPPNFPQIFVPIPRYRRTTPYLWSPDRRTTPPPHHRPLSTAECLLMHPKVDVKAPMKGVVVVEGKSADCITKASETIQSVINEAVKNPSLDYSHFISLPLAIHPELIDKLTSFQKSILKDVGFQDKSADAVPLVSYGPKASRSNASPSKPGSGPLRIERSIFINPKTFHLTVLMLKLWNEECVHSAMEVFQSISSQVIEALDGRPIFVRLTGLECMKGSLRNAQVLYIPIEEMGNEGRLMRACKVITDAYIKAGLVLGKDATRSLKLHATVMNSRHRTRTRGPKKNIPFDATGIFERYGSEEWGDYNIREVHLSQRCVVVAAFDWVLPQQPH